ncbi:MAG: hypothetical protein ABEI39_02975 [Halobacteriales archaeon]
MTVEQLERETLGQPLEPADRLVAGVIAVVGAVGHAALGLAVLTLLYALVVVA